MYADHAENVAEIKEHRVLAVNRGEKEGFLKVKITFNDQIAKRVAGAGYLKKRRLCDAARAGSGR